MFTRNSRSDRYLVASNGVGTIGILRDSLTTVGNGEAVRSQRITVVDLFGAVSRDCDRLVQCAGPFAVQGRVTGNLEGCAGRLRHRNVFMPAGESVNIRAVADRAALFIGGINRNGRFGGVIVTIRWQYGRRWITHPVVGDMISFFRTDVVTDGARLSCAHCRNIRNQAIIRLVLIAAAATVSDCGTHDFISRIAFAGNHLNAVGKIGVAACKKPCTAIILSLNLIQVECDFIATTLRSVITPVR